MSKSRNNQPQQIKDQVYVGFRRGTGIMAFINRERLVTQWSHSAVRVGDTVYQASPFKGVFESVVTDDYNQGFTWVRVHNADAGGVRKSFYEVQGAAYDWFGLLAFILPNRVGTDNIFYCHEFVSHVLGLKKRYRYTPETIMAGILEAQL